MTRNREIALIATITALGAALRLYQIGAQSLWFDELLSIAVSRLSLRLVLVSPASIDPPLYYVLLHWWLALGNDDGLVRLLSAIPGIATIPAIYSVAKRLTDVRVAFVAAMIFALSPLQLYYAQEARMYALLVFLTTLSLWSYLVAQEQGRARNWAVWIVASILAVYTHSFAGLLLVAIDVDAVLRWTRKRNRLEPVILSNAVIVVGLLPEILVTLSKLSWLMPALWLSSPTLLHPLLTLDAFLFGYTLPSWSYVISLFVLIAMVAFVAVASWRRIRWGSDQEKDTLQFMWLVLFVPIGLTWAVSQWRSVYLDRLLLPSSTALYILLAWGLVKSNRRRVIGIFAGIGLPLILGSLLNYYTVAEYAKPPMREVLSFVAARRMPDERIIHTSDSSFLAGHYYDPGGDHVLLYHPADQWLIPVLMDELQVRYARSADEITEGRDSFWLIIAGDHILEEQMKEKAELDLLATVIEQTEIGRIDIVHYVARRK